MQHFWPDEVASNLRRDPQPVQRFCYLTLDRVQAYVVIEHIHGMLDVYCPLEFVNFMESTIS